jgi:dTDP-4-dehydrorhamnose 3,5-epimerase
MRAVRTDLTDVFLIEPTMFGDERGHFFESFNERRFRELIGVDARFVQDNQSRSARHVLRGLHYQVRQPQGKLVRVLSGSIFDVCVDLRRDSPTFGRWTGVTLSGEDRRAIWIPVGFAHGFLTLSERADVFYKTTDYYAPEHERAIAWNDPTIGVEWPLTAEPVLSGRDRSALPFSAADTF